MYHTITCFVSGLSRRRSRSAFGARLVLAALGAGTFLYPIPSSAAPPPAPNPISFYYLRSVECPADRKRPVQLDFYKAPRTGKDMYRFHDKRSGRTFRDGETIVAAFAQMARAGGTRHAGASGYAVPREFREATTQSTLYLTAPQRKEAEALRAELQAWRGLLAASPRVLTSADLEPNAVAARETSADQKTRMMVRLTLTAAGAKKMEGFTRKHRREVLGFVLNPEKANSRLLMAPTIMQEITGTALQIGVYPTLSEAQAVAKQINAR